MVRSVMEVILLEDVRNVGKLGSKVKVSSGYGRNFLIPQEKAKSATAANITEFEANRAVLEKKAKDRLEAAQERAQALLEQSYTMAANAGDEGKLFGSIGTRDIAAAISKSGLDVSKSEVRLSEGTIRQVGEYDVTLQLHSEVVVEVKLVVVPE